MKGINIFLKERKIRHQYACERHRNLSEEEKNKKQKYGRKRYKNLSENEKQKLFESRKNYSGMWGNKPAFQVNT